MPEHIIDRVQSATTSRRQALRTGGMAALASIAAAFAGGLTAKAAPSGDTELLALVREFHQCDAQLQAWNRERDIPDEAFDPVHDRWWEIVDTIEDTTPTTQAGLLAKALMLPVIVRDCGDATEAETLFAMSLVRDISAAAERRV